LAAGATTKIGACWPRWADLRRQAEPANPSDASSEEPFSAAAL
jgi:hypothetical protein